MGNPTKVFVAEYLKANLLKRTDVFFKRGKIALVSFLCAHLILELALEEGIPIIHIDNHAESAWHQ
jgi:hypothetical protein